MTSVLSFVIAWACSAMLGQPGDFDASEKMRAIEATFRHLAVDVPAAGLRRRPRGPQGPPFTAIFLGALVGGALAVLVAPDRVIAFAGTGDGIQGGSCSLKGVWLALANGYSSNDRLSRHRSAGDPRRHGQHAEHGLADHHGTCLRLRDLQLREPTRWRLPSRISACGCSARRGRLEQRARHSQWRASENDRRASAGYHLFSMRFSDRRGPHGSCRRTPRSRPAPAARPRRPGRAP